MSLRRFFENNRAVSPVIGVVLMVAITVILAAAIGSSVFGEGTSNPAPQANLQLSVNSTYGSAVTPGFASINIEHLGGDPINFTTNTTTKVMVHAAGFDSQEVAAGYALSTDTLHTNLATMAVGDTKVLNLYNYTVSGGKHLAIVDAASGATVNVKIIDVATNQLICDQDLRF